MRCLGKLIRCITYHTHADFKLDTDNSRDIFSGVMKIEIEQEVDGRWIADVVDLAGVMAYGQTRADAIAKVQALALRVLADRLEHGECLPHYTASAGI